MRDVGFGGLWILWVVIRLAPFEFDVLVKSSCRWIVISNWIDRLHGVGRVIVSMRGLP